jgi:hypothetical protein
VSGICTFYHHHLHLHPHLHFNHADCYSYYVWGIEEAKVLILISESQFQELVTEINIGLQLSLRITDQQREEGLVGRFPDHPRCQPRYLGRSRSKDEYNSLVDNVPSELFRLTGEPEMTALEGNTLADFKKAWEDMLDATKAKSKATKEKRKVDRLMKQKVFADQFKRAQRYLGLRPTAHGAYIAQCPSYTTLLTRCTGKTAPPLEAIDSSLPAPFQFDQSVVFVCVDVEAYERAHDIITEIGISTLDTRDLNGVAPGEDGASWRSKIHARHFRIQEYHHLVNSKYVSGCPERFDFGKSEFVRKNDAADMVAKCFEAPFCGPGPRTDASRAEKRNLIFLGHDTLGDVKYLQQVGFDALKLPNLLESQDTAVLYRVWRRELQSTKLGNILYDFDIPGFNLHNAGNDAMLTLQALLGILVREASTRGTTELQTARAEEVKAMVSAATEEAEEKTLDEFNGWDQHENDGDGGAPVPIVIKETPHLAISKRPASPVNSEGRGRGRGGFVGVGGRGGNISNGYVPTYTNDSNAYNTGGYRGNRGSQTNSRGDGRGGGHGRGRGRGSHNYNNSSGSNGGASGQQVGYDFFDIS